MNRYAFGICLPILTVSGSLSATPYMEEIIVTSSRIEMPLRQVGTSVSVLTTADIQARGYTSLADVLRTQTAIGVSNLGGQGKQTSLRIRGEEGYRTLVRIDGVEVSDPTGTQVGPQFQHILSSGISRVEILRGPQGMMYGADAGGVVNIITNTTESGLNGGISYEAGRYGTQQASGYIGAGNDNADVYLSVTDYQTDGYNSLKVDSVLKDDDGYDNQSYHFKAGYNFTQKLRLDMVYRDVESKNEFDSVFGTSDRNSDYDEKTYRVALKYSGDVIGHSLAVAKTEVERENIAAGSITFSTEGEIDKFEYLGSTKLSQELALVYGLELEKENIISSSGESEDRDQLGYFVEIQNQIDDQLFFTAGVRQDDNDDFGKHTSYRLTAAYVVDLTDGDSLKYKASYGTGFRAPSLSEIAYNASPFAFAPASEEELSEETSEGFDLGLEYAGAQGFRVEMVYFDQEIEDELFFDLVGFSGYLQAEGIARSKGVEFTLESPLGDRLELLTNYTYNDTDSPEGESRSRRPVHLANLGLAYDLVPDKWNLLVNLRVARDAKNEVFGVGFVDLDDYEVVDITTRYQLGGNAEIYARVENVTDEEYEEVTGYNTARPAVYAGLRLSF